MEFLKDLNPSALIVVGMIWAIREFLGFIKSMQQKAEAREKAKKNSISATMELELKAMTRILEKVAEHIEVQTDLMKGVVFEMKSTRNDLEYFKDEFRRDLDEVKRRLPASS